MWINSWNFKICEAANKMSSKLQSSFNSQKRKLQSLIYSSYVDNKEHIYNKLSVLLSFKIIFHLICIYQNLLNSWMGAKKYLLLKVCHTYPAMMKLGTVIPYLKKIQKIYKPCDTPFEFCWHQHLFTRIH